MLALARELSLGDRDVALAPQAVELVFFLPRQSVPRGGARRLQLGDAALERSVERGGIRLEFHDARQLRPERVMELAVRRLRLVHLRSFDPTGREERVENLRRCGGRGEGCG